MEIRLSEGPFARLAALFGLLRAPARPPKAKPALAVVAKPAPAPAAKTPPAPKLAPVPAPPPPGPVSSATDFAALEPEYRAFWAAATLRPERRAEAERLARALLAQRARYEAAAAPVGAPWWFVAAIHLLEAGMSFRSHLHNGDPLSARTVHVPAGRPVAGAPPFTWEESAADALAVQGIGRETAWSIPRALWRWETWNGFGYRRRGVPTPYLWSFTDRYSRGKYVADGRFDPAAVSAQCGAAAVLKLLENWNVLDDAARLAPAHPFQAFFDAHLAGVRHFTWKELLHKGGSPLAAELNEDPPAALWPNVAPLVRLLDRFRETIGAPVRLLSVYRAPAYNARLKGASEKSQHLAFRAADLVVLGPDSGRPADWARLLRTLRGANREWEGGIGLYDTFVHVDVRGHRTDWDYRS